jgi:hypothetical protein
MLLVSLVIINTTLQSPRVLQGFRATTFPHAITLGDLYTVPSMRISCNAVTKLLDRASPTSPSEQTTLNNVPHRWLVPVEWDSLSILQGPIVPYLHVRCEDMHSISPLNPIFTISSSGTTSSSSTYPLPPPPCHPPPWGRSPHSPLRRRPPPPPPPSYTSHTCTNHPTPPSPTPASP